SFLRGLSRSMAAEMLTGDSDGELVEKVIVSRDPSAFEAILRRHGPMVYRVCWRVLRHNQDVEDAFHATFLVLAPKVRTVRNHASLASWLHGVAHRLALKARARAATRCVRERKAAVSEASDLDLGWADVRALLDEELARLPEKWRLPLVLCYLEGRTQD